MARTKADVVADLEAKKIAFDPEATKAELEALLDAAPEAPATPGAVETPAVEVEEPTDGKGVAVVLSKNGQYARSYSKAIHGKEYKDLAKQYAAKIKGSVQ